MWSWLASGTCFDRGWGTLVDPRDQLCLVGELGEGHGDSCLWVGPVIVSAALLFGQGQWLGPGWWAEPAAMGEVSSGGRGSILSGASYSGWSPDLRVGSVHNG